MEPIEFTYICLHETDGRELCIKANSIVWMRALEDGTNIGLGSGTMGLFATTVKESIPDIIDKLN